MVFHYEKYMKQLRKIISRLLILMRCNIHFITSIKRCIHLPDTPQAWDSSVYGYAPTDVGGPHPYTPHPLSTPYPADRAATE